jgi:hypothetical protein
MESPDLGLWPPPAGALFSAHKWHRTKESEINQGIGLSCAGALFFYLYSALVLELGEAPPVIKRISYTGSLSERGVKVGLPTIELLDRTKYAPIRSTKSTRSTILDLDR